MDQGEGEGAPAEAVSFDIEDLGVALELPSRTTPLPKRAVADNEGGGRIRMKRRPVRQEDWH